MEESFLSVRNGIVLPFLPDGRGGVCDEKMNFIEESKYKGDWLKFGGFYDVTGGGNNDIKFSEDKVIFLGYFFKHWGHFIMDCLGRAWFLCKGKVNDQILPCDFDLDDYKVAFLTRNGRSVDGNFFRFFELLGLKKEQLINVDCPTKFKEVLIPTCAHWAKDDELCVRPFQCVSENWTSQFEETDMERNTTSEKYSYEKIYLSREHFWDAKQKEIGEGSIRQMFELNGYKVCYPETLSLDDQIAMFKSAAAIACVNGTIPLNVVYGSKKAFNSGDCKIIVLNKMSIPHRNLEKVAHALNINIDYINIYREPINGHPRLMGEGPFWIGPGKEISDYFASHDMTCGTLHNDGVTSRLVNTGNYIRYYWRYVKIKVNGKAVKTLRIFRNTIFAWRHHVG